VSTPTGPGPGTGALGGGPPPAPPHRGGATAVTPGLSGVGFSGPDPLRPGDPPTIGPYRLLGRLGAGGMGTVYLALREPGTRTGAPTGTRAADAVALKVVRPEYADDPVYRGRFRREAQAAERVRGPGVAEVLDADADAPLPYLVTRYVPGPSLRAHVAAAGPLRDAALDAFAVGVARALTVVHAAGVVHRDLKPANVLLGPAGPCLVDFGIARPADAATSFTGTGEIIGSMGWMAPEVLRQERSGPPADVFGWGAVVAYAATGRRPFGDGPEAAVAHRVLAGPPPDLRGLPPRLAGAVAAALQPEPAARPSAAALADALSMGLPVRAPGVDATRRMGVDPTRVAPRRPAPPPRRGRRRRGGLLLGVLAAAALVAAVARQPGNGAGADGTPAQAKPRTAARPTPTRTARPAPRPTATRATPATEPATEPATAGPGTVLAAALQPARENGVQFRVTALTCGLRTVGSGVLAYDLPAGKRGCTADVVVRNLGRGTHVLPWQYLHGPGGEGYASNALLAPALGHPPLEGRTLTAGGVLHGSLVWELPPGVTPVDVEVHSDLLTLGVRRRVH
jgi:hypothetical protein